MLPLLSIITINLNQAAGLNRTLQSLKSQSWRDFELIVVDGDSNDDSHFILNTFHDIIKTLIIERDEGIYHAMNKGWRQATGQYCLFLNAGDSLHDGSVLENVSGYLIKGENDFYFGNIVSISSNGETGWTEFSEPVCLHYLFRWYLPHPASFIKRSLLIQFNGYIQNYRIISDWIFTVLVFLSGARFNHMPLTVSDFYTDGISSTQHEKAAFEKQEVFEQELSFLKHDWLWFLKMRPLELSRPVHWLFKIISFIRLR